jgi:hypothetical protein
LGKSVARADVTKAINIQGEANCTDRRIKLTVASGDENPIRIIPTTIPPKVNAAIIKNSGQPLSAL